MDVLSTKIPDAGCSVRLAERVSGKASECRRRRRNTYRPRKVRRRRIHLVQMKDVQHRCIPSKGSMPMTKLSDHSLRHNKVDSSPHRLDRVAGGRKPRLGHRSRTIHTIPRIVAPIVAVMAQIYACLNAILRLSSVRSSRKSLKFHSRSSMEIVGSGIGIPLSSAVEVEGVRLMGE